MDIAASARLMPYIADAKRFSKKIFKRLKTLNYKNTLALILFNLLLNA